MRLFLTFCTVLILSLFARLPLQGGELLINTQFDQTDAKGALRIVSPSAVNTATLPLTMPTSIQAKAPSAITPGGDDKTLAGPHAIFFIGARPDQPIQSSRVEMQWDLRGLHLSTGRYVLSARVTPLDADIAGFNLRLNLAGEDGAWIWPFKPPLLVAYGKDVIRTETGQTGPAYAVGVTATISIALDLDEQSWTVSVDGKPIMPPAPFDLFKPDAGLMLGGVFIRALDQPGRRVAVSDLKLERLAEKSPPIPARLEAEKLPRIACVGDSITQGYGLRSPDRDSYPSVLRRLLAGKAMVGNFGISGTTILKNGDSPYWKQWAFARAKQFAPDIVVIGLGANDSKPGNWTHADEIAGDTAALVKAFRELPSQPKVVLVLPAPVFKPAFGITEELLAKVRLLVATGATQAGATVVESVPVFATHEAWFLDGVHPNEEGAAALARLVADHLPARTK